MLLLAAAAAGPVETPTSGLELEPSPVSLRATPEDCRRSAAAGDIVVCGRSADEFRLKEIVPPKGLKVHERGVVGFNLGGSRVEPRLDQVQMPDGRVGKRIMVTVKVPF